ncbi:MAG TPA: flagellar hook-associated protein FlgL [Solirubrobacter sp.]|nr:flagellar hook-associated protein FlgL [Solirubrobacter sp.]
MRITTSMIQRNVLSDLNALSEKLAHTQARASSGKQITRASDDPFATAKAMGLRTSLSGTDQYVSNIDDARGWQDSTEAALATINDYVSRAQSLLVQGSTDTADQTSRNAIASEIDQLIDGIKESANATYGDKYLLSGTETAIPPYKLGADDAYYGNEAGWDPAVPGVLREIGPGVTLSINSVAREVLGDGQAAGDGKLLNTLRDIADHLRSSDGASLRGNDVTNLQDDLNALLDVRARNGALTNRLEAASTRMQQIQESVTKQLSETEDADIAKTMIDFSSQSAAYQASLRAGANIVQASLMDFLR